MGSFVALEAGGTSIVGSMGSAFSSVASDCMSAISASLPIALPVMGALVVVGLGIKVFKKVTGR